MRMLSVMVEMSADIPKHNKRIYSVSSPKTCSDPICFAWWNCVLFSLCGTKRPPSFNGRRAQISMR